MAMKQPQLKGVDIRCFRVAITIIAIKSLKNAKKAKDVEILFYILGSRLYQYITLLYKFCLCLF